MAESKSRIGQILIREGVIDAETERKAAEIQDQHPSRKFGEILVRDLGVDHHAIFSRLAKVYAFKEFDFQAEGFEEAGCEFVKKALEALPDAVREQALAKRVLPLKALDKPQDRLLVVTPDPTDREVMGIAGQFGYRRPEIYYGRLDVIEGLIDRIFPPKNEFLDILKSVDAPAAEEMAEEHLDEASLDAEINQSMLTNLVEGCLVEAVRQGASDIHIIPQEGNRTEFHFRVDGNLQLWYAQEATKPEAVVAVVKDRSRGVDRFEREKAQDGFIQRQIDGFLIRFRVSVLPIAGAQPERRFESVVIRILDDRKVVTDLGKLGLQAAALNAFQAAITRPQGIVILTGPTGSGKSTTLNAALHSVIDPTVCVLTIEDPVEYILRGARQIKIGPRLRFEDAVRAILRHDPDIVMVGEMRDLETAQTAIKLANTGHLTFSTLHTNDAPSAISRLYKMGVEPFLIANAINIVVAQRLIRTLCKECRQPADQVDGEAYLQAGMNEAQLAQARIHQPVGCPACNNTGHKGRAGIHEALLFTKEIRQLIISSGGTVDEEAIRSLAISQGMMTLRQSGLGRVAEGQATLDEVLAATTTDE
ncbi:MAG: type II/IV secretion system protein [Candidatus Latescibacteria bacterium]|nr:type II/IV secretion system protein [Candidatus Latescibacterota bacterium]